MNHAFEHVAEFVCNDVALAPLYLLARVVSASPPALVVFTDWLSITPAVGDGVRPSDIRTHATSTVDDIEQAVVAHPVEMVLHR